MEDLKFVTDIFSEKEANAVVLRVNCPQSLIEASQMFEPFDIEKKKNLLENTRIFDAGEVKLGEVTVRTKKIMESGKLPMLLAERHVASLEAVKALPKGTKLVVFDAHSDMKDEYAEGDYKPVDKKTNYATWLRRACEAVGVESIFLLGVRSCDEDESEFMKNIAYATAWDIKNSMSQTVKRLAEFLNGAKAYVSIDVDVFDPSIAPAVENPEPNGLSYGEFMQLIEAMQPKNIIGMDLVEIRPLERNNRVTEFLAVKVIFEILSLIFS